MFKNVLVLLDGSPSSERAIPWARALSSRRPSLLQVIEPIYLYDLPAPLDIPLDEEARRYLRKVAAEQAPGSTLHVKIGPVISTILDTVGETDADLIVAARHDGPELPRRLWGGTVDRLIHRVLIPLLIVPARGLSFPPLALECLVAEDSESVMPWVRKLARWHRASIERVAKESLVQAASERHADMIVATAFRQNLLQRMWFGDRTSQIIDRSPAPVLFVPCGAAEPVPAATGKEARS